MNKLVPLHDLSPVKHIPIPIRLTMGVFSAHIITTGGEAQNFSELVKLKGYPIAMLVSFVIAQLAIEQIQYFTIVLHKRFPIYDAKHIKLVWQIVTCLIGPFLSIFMLASIYYAANGYFILDTLWPSVHGWPILMMLMVLNLVFTISYGGIPIPALSVKKPAPQEGQLMVIVYVLHEDGLNKVFYSDGSYMTDARSLADIFKSLEPGEYIVNLRCCIIKRSNIKAAYLMGDGTSTVEVLVPANAKTIFSARQKGILNGYYSN